MDFGGDTCTPPAPAGLRSHTRGVQTGIMSSRYSLQLDFAFVATIVRRFMLIVQGCSTTASSSLAHLLWPALNEHPAYPRMPLLALVFSSWSMVHQFHCYVALAVSSCIPAIFVQVATCSSLFYPYPPGNDAAAILVVVYGWLALGVASYVLFFVSFRLDPLAAQNSGVPDRGRRRGPRSRTGAAEAATERPTREAANEERGRPREVSVRGKPPRTRPRTKGAEGRRWR